MPVKKPVPKTGAALPKKTSSSGTSGLPKTTTAVKRAALAADGTATGSTTKHTTAPPANNDPGRAPDSPPLLQSTPPAPVAEPTVTAASIAASLYVGGRNNRRWGSGRERDVAIKKAGFDPKEVARELRKLRASKKS